MMIEFVSPKTGKTLRKKDQYYVSPENEKFPIIDDIVRFVETESYTDSFGHQWKEFRKTQLDSYTGIPISKPRLARCLGVPLEKLNGQNVLEAGCGAGRFTELLVSSGANVHAVDMSSAVEVNYENVGTKQNYKVAQGDLLALPFPKASFDWVLCLGVLQHLPSPEEGIEALWQMVKPGGYMVIDHYTRTTSNLLRLQPIFRFYLKRQDPKKAQTIISKLNKIFLPWHRRFKEKPIFRKLLNRISPCVTYYDAFKDLSERDQDAWAELDTFDSLTDTFKHYRTERQIQSFLRSLGATEIETRRAGNGIEAKCRKIEII